MWSRFLLVAVVLTGCETYEFNCNPCDFSYYQGRDYRPQARRLMPISQTDAGYDNPGSTIFGQVDE